MSLAPPRIVSITELLVGVAVSAYLSTSVIKRNRLQRMNVAGAIPCAARLKLSFIRLAVWLEMSLCHLRTAERSLPATFQTVNGYDQASQPRRLALNRQLSTFVLGRST